MDNLNKVVVIGGSAGALDALRRLFQSAPAERDLAYVVLVHHSPTHETVLDSLLAGWSGRPASIAEHGMRLRPGHIHVARPGEYVEITGGRFRCTARTVGVGPHHSIDRLLQSVAHEFGPRALAVILSGTGSDGTLGAAAVHEAGGRVVVQSPDTCAHGAMPASVLRRGLAHEQLPPHSIAKRCHTWSREDHAMDSVDEGPQLDHDAAFEAILALVREHSGNDLSGYRPTTLLRRVDRRASLNHCRTLPDYLTYLRETPAEVDRLAKDMLIGVTAFFRDDEAFRLIESEVVPAICAAKPAGEAVRVWVAGCSTGEEVYSVAMLLHEWFADRDQPPRVQIFATDIDEAALEAARAGRYPRAALEHLPPARVARHFVEKPDGFTIAKSVRESIVFAAHNLISDPPFSRLDLLLCRNVLIYLNAATQRKLLTVFHFIINPGAFLFLGSSESVGAMARHFDPVSKQWRIFRHRADAVAKRPPPTLMLNAGTPRRASGGAPLAPEIGSLAAQERVYRRLIESHGPALVLANARLEILYVEGDASGYLEYPAGEPTQDLFRVVRAHLRVALRSVVNRALRDQVKAAVSTVAQGEDGQPARDAAVRLTATPVPSSGEEPLLLVAFDTDPDVRTVLPLAGTGGDDWLLQQMEQELNATREDLQRTIESMRLSNEESTAATEEIMAMNEELQSANEELESSKEELQSLNEELATANAALDLKVGELERTNADLHNLLLSTETATLFLDPQLRIRRFTAACTQLMRVIPADVGRSLGDIVQIAGNHDLTEVCQQVLAGEPVPDRELRNAEGRWFLRRILPYRTHDGAVHGVVLTFPDITAVKDNEAELERRNEQLEWQAHLLREAPVLARDLADRIIFWNHGAQTLYGWSPDEALGRVSDELLHSRFEMPRDQIRALLLADSSWRGRITHTRRDGSQCVVDSEWTLQRDKHGNPVAIVEVNNDITDQVAAETQLAEHRDHLEDLVRQRTADLVAARQAAELANQAKGAFLTNMSHEIRTPLNAITGMAYLMRQADLPPEQIERVEKIQVAGDLLLEIINSILDLSKIEAGKVTLESVPLNVDTLLHDVASLIDDRARAKGLRVTIEPPSQPIAVMGDPTCLRQALLNFASNAVKFTDSGEIALCARVLEQGSVDVLLRLEVRDTGMGIDDAHLQRLFMPFEQGDSSIGRKFGGTGLGLAITKRLAELMGGDVGADSAVGVGSTFWFTARLARGSAVPAPAARPASSDGEAALRREHAGHRVLLAEDEPVNREVMLAMLQAVGLTVDTARDGAEALTLASAGRHAAILLDMQMPVMDGLEAARRIRALPQTRATPILAVTANAFTDDQARCLEAGMNDIVTKPVDPQQLYTTLLRWMAARSSH